MINIIRNRLEIVNDNEIVMIDGIDIKDKDVLEIINKSREAQNQSK